MEIFAHRGASGSYPENTIVAFQAAAQLPITGVELDVHLTKDQQLVVIHDETIDRTSNGTGFVKDLTLKQLKEYDFGGWFGAGFIGEKIPTLSEVLTLFATTNHQINIELKSDVFAYEGMEKLVWEEVEAHDLTARTLISSFDHEALQRLARIAPQSNRAALFSAVVIDIENYITHIPAQAMHVALPTAFRKPIIDAVRNDATVRVYTVNDALYAQELALLGVTSIFTDYPEEMVAYFQQ